MLELTDPGELVVGDDRLIKFELAAMFWRFSKQILFGADIGNE